MLATLASVTRLSARAKRSLTSAHKMTHSNIMTFDRLALKLCDNCGVENSLCYVRERFKKCVAHD